MNEPDPESSLDSSALEPKLGKTAREYVARYRDEFARAIRRGGKGVDSARGFSSALDGLFGSLFAAADAASRPLAGEGRVALVAVGGYGRGYVALHGDADVLLLADDPTSPRVAALTEAFLYPLWDIGFDVGHVVRGVDETAKLARDDVRTATTLLDLRRVGGDDSLVRELVKEGRRQVFEPNLNAFLDAMVAEADARHARFGDSLYLLEPEVKLGRGGLRDLDIADWAGRAGFGVSSNEDLIRLGAYLPREWKQIESAREMLWRVRNLLHLRAGRKHDRLTFADQEDIAEELGFVDGITLGVEQFMQAYYRHARVVAQTSERMLERARPKKLRKRAQAFDLGDGTMLFDGTITFEKAERLSDDPAVALRLYRQVVKHRRPPYTFARDAIASHCADRSFRHRLLQSEEATQLFLDLLVYTGEVPVRGGSLLEELHESGILVAMIPELEPLMGRVHHDVYHVYTVDVHTVMAVDQLRSFFRGEELHLLPAASRVAAEITRPLPVFVAVLLHAVGKARGGDWVRNGVELCKPIARRLGLEEEDVEYVSWLVQEQGLLYRIATQRDTNDPDVVADLARQVSSVDRLRDLFLVNASILSTISPSAMSHWKARMIEDLLFATLAELAGTAERAGDERINAIRTKTREASAGDPATLAFIDSMPDRYLLGHSVDAVLRHAKLAEEASGCRVLVRVTPGADDDATEVAVLADDRPGLLADAAAVLARNRLGIVDAQIYTHQMGERPRAFDIFHVSRDSRAGGDPSALEARLASELSALLDGTATAEDWIAKTAKVPSWAQRRSPDVATEIFVENDVSSKFTVIDLFTRDRVGLLYVIASTLHEQGLSISLAKVNTEGERVADVFYVQDASGHKLVDAARIRALCATLEARIDQFHTESQGARA